jgi:hypothetical protein
MTRKFYKVKLDTTTENERRLARVADHGRTAAERHVIFLRT